MNIRSIAPLFAVALVLSACGSSKFQTYDGPEVTSLQVHKEARKLYLLHHDRVLKSYDIGLGFDPVGHKAVEGDGRTPEGAYTIDRRNPNSRYHLSIGISYPNPYDVQVARGMGMSPGGDIFIHGVAGARGNRGRDWTAGCIAVEDKEMEEIYAMVGDGTPIHLLP